MALVVACGDQGSDSASRAATSAPAPIGSSPLGEPVLVRLETREGRLPYEVALALGEGVPLGPHLPKVVSVLHGFVSACPAVVEALSPGEIANVRFLVRGGVVAEVRSSGEAPCATKHLMSRALDLPDGTAVAADLRRGSTVGP
jgi:hypothetical protein